MRRMLRALVGPGSAGEMHPTDTGPGWTDEDGRPAVIVRCPVCKQLEWWSSRECEDHGKCRASMAPCWCEGAEGGAMDTLAPNDPLPRVRVLAGAPRPCERELKRVY